MLADILLRSVVFILGVLIVVRTLASAVRTLVLPRSARDPIALLVFGIVRRVFNLRAHKLTSYERRDGIMALYAPVSLLALPVVWLVLILLGYVGIYWALGAGDLYHAFTLSGSSLFTLGFERQDEWVMMAAMFSEAAIGLILIALLISYLPTMYGAFSRRETAVTMLEVRAGNPPSVLEMISRAHRIRGLDALTPLWEEWEVWFSDIEESHTSLAALVFFRSPNSGRSWVTASGTILDTAAFCASSLDRPRNPSAELCIRAGYIALRAVADYFQVDYNANPASTDPISISREEYDAVYDELAALGVPLKPDRNQCWRDFAGWRVNYDTVLLALAALTMAPYAPWSSDRSLPRVRRRWLHK